MCSCGESDHKRHEIGKGVTADGVRVSLYADGAFTRGLAREVVVGASKGRGWSQARREQHEQCNVRAGWLALGEVSLYDAAELMRLVKLARLAVRQRSTEPLSYLRLKMAGFRIQRLGKGSWQWTKRL